MGQGQTFGEKNRLFREQAHLLHPPSSSRRLGSLQTPCRGQGWLHQAVLEVRPCQAQLLLGSLAGSSLTPFPAPLLMGCDLLGTRRSVPTQEPKSKAACSPSREPSNVLVNSGRWPTMARVPRPGSCTCHLRGSRCPMPSFRASTSSSVKWEEL